MKGISLLGSTGSIGRQTLDIAAAHRDRLEVVALAAGKNNLPMLAAQIRDFHPELVSVPDAESAQSLKEELAGDLPKTGVEIMHGSDGLNAVAAHRSAQTVVTAVVGVLGLRPTLAAINEGKTIALANKETLVAAGAVIMPLIKEKNARIVPVDSEHSAIFQSLAGHTNQDIDRIWLTGSGGPFRTWSMEQIKRATMGDALKHPNWAMGRKITIDSATLMNKGLEIIEARWLFDLEADRINVVIHPQSILHSAVEFKDGSIVGQMGLPDMRLPIHYAIFYPERVPSERVPRLNLWELAAMNFEHPDLEKFPCLALAQQAAREDSTMACVLNAANEVIVESFLNGDLAFFQIAEHLKRVLARHNATSRPGLEDILEADMWARKEARAMLNVKAG